MSLVLNGWVGQFDNGGGTNANLSVELNAFSGLFDPSSSSDTPGSPYGLKLLSTPLAQSDVLPGYLGHGYFDDLYNRIYVVPSSINVGNLVSNQSRDVVLWNAYVTPVTVESATFTNGTGLVLNLPAGITLPHELSALAELPLEVQLDVGGPPTINASLDITVEGELYSVPITGKRVVLFPFRPDWASPFDETFVHRSWAIRSEDGSEQTGSEGGNHPRRMFEFNITMMSEHEINTFENLMFAWHARFFAVPHWAEQSYLESPIVAGDDTLEFDTAGMTLEVGGLVAVYQDFENYEVREIASVAGDLVTVTTAFDFPWPVNTRVMPCFVALANEDVSGSYDTTRVARMPVSFECEPSQTAGNTETGAAPLTYRGFELYLGKINWNASLSFGFRSDQKKIDMNVGKFGSTSTSGYSVYRRAHNWTLFTGEDAQLFRQFLGRRQGVAVPVYMPSGKPDFILAAPSVEDDDFLTVRDNGYTDLVGAHPARRDIIVHFNDGTYITRRITSAVNVVGGTRLNLDAMHGRPITADLVMRISYLTLYRFESASTTIRWLTNNKGTVQSTMLSTQPGG